MKNRSFKGPWIITAVAALLAAAILTLGNRSFEATEKAAFGEFNQRQLVLAKGTASGIELYIENLAGDMRALARIPEIQQLDEAPTRQELQDMFYELEPWGVNDVAVLDADGFLRYNVMAHEIEGVDFSWRRYYQEARQMTSGDAYAVEFIEFKGVEAAKRGSWSPCPCLRPRLTQTVLLQRVNSREWYSAPSNWTPSPKDSWSPRSLQREDTFS